MKKIFLLIVAIITSFIFIIKPKAIASAYSSLNGKFFETGSWITVKSGSEYTINFGAYNGVNGNAGLIYVRYNYCVFDFNSFTIDREEITVTKTNQSCKFSNAPGNAHVYSVDVKFLFSASDKTLTYGATFHPYREGGVGNLSIELLDYYELDPSQLTIDKNQQETNEKLDNIDNTMKDDDIDTSGSNSFFNDFDTKDHGGLSSIVTSPLKAYAKITAKCTPINMTVLDKSIALPCGDTLFWNKSEVSSFRIIWNILLGGPILYALLVKLFNTIERLKNPDDDRIEVAKL